MFRYFIIVFATLVLANCYVEKVREWHHSINKGNTDAKEEGFNDYSKDAKDH